MSTINLKNAGHRAGDLLFSNLTLSISNGDHIGLVAPNGRGKSTLLRAIAGELELSEGEITRSRGLKLGYVPQDIAAEFTALTLREFVASGLDAETLESEGWRVDVVLEEFSIPAEFRDLPLNQLSGGWRRMALLAKCWVGEPDGLLMDEPTNHLDLSRIVALEEWLAYAAKSMPVIIASHDRAFLDRVTNRTLFLRPDGGIDMPLPYSAARQELDRIDASAEAQRERDLKEASQLRKQAAKLTNIGINSGSDLLTVKSKQLRERAEKIETQVHNVHRDRTGLVKLGNSGAEARVMLNFGNVSVTKPNGDELFRIEKLHIFQGDRIVVLGKNGAGKTQFMRCLARALEGQLVEGLKVSPQLVPGYMDQELAWLPTKETALDYLVHRFDEGDQRTVALLAGAGFAPDRQTKQMATYSMGQRARVALLALRLAKPNFYLLDEPTNHLDIPGQEQLEDDICGQGATTILVTHDRAFLRAVGTRFFEIRGKRLIEVEGPEAFFSSMGAG